MWISSGGGDAWSVPFVDPYNDGPAGAPFGVPPDTNLPIWVDVQIPKDAATGVYTGTISIRSEGAETMKVPVSLEVWDLTLPDSRSVSTRFKIDWSDVNGFHKGMDTAYPNDNPKTKDYVKRYQELAHTHRLDIGEIWLPYPNGCSPPTDWEDFDAVLAPYMDGSYWDDGVANSTLGVGIGVGDPNPECSESEYVGVAKAWSTHLKDKGWFTKSLVAGADEPSEDLYPVIAGTSSRRSSTRGFMGKAVHVAASLFSYHGACRRTRGPQPGLGHRGQRPRAAPGARTAPTPPRGTRIWIASARWSSDEETVDGYGGVVAAQGDVGRSRRSQHPLRQQRSFASGIFRPAARCAAGRSA